jgi:hypothetical protein
VHTLGGKMKPDIVMYAYIDIDGMHMMSGDEKDCSFYNVKLIFDGDAENYWDLKDVEVLK